MEKQTVKSSIIGKVTSNKMNKTAVIETTKKVKDQRYSKYVVRTSTYYAHDADDKCKIGDIVRIQESRPYSKKKTWDVVEIIEQSK